MCGFISPRNGVTIKKRICLICWTPHPPPKNMNEPGGYEWLQGKGARGAAHWWLHVVMLHHLDSLGTACGLKLGLQITISLFETAPAPARERAHRHAVMLIPRLWRHERGCVTQVAVLQMKMPIWHVLIVFWHINQQLTTSLSFWPVCCHEKIYFGNPNCLKWYNSQ